MNTAVTVGSSTTRIVEGNKRRRFLSLVNNSNEDMYIALDQGAASTYGIPLKASGGALVLEQEHPGDYIYQGEVNGICASGGKVLSVCELDL